MPPRPLVVGLGEALFDCFADREVLGGAPLNVAIHAQAVLAPHGGTACPVTRVGADSLGDRCLAEIKHRGLATEQVQRDTERPTGRVAVSLNAAGDANYRFEDDCAWDALAFDNNLAALARRCDGVAFGTLAQRSTGSRQAITDFIATATQAVRLFDANLRQRLYSAEVLDTSLRLASMVKLNEEELREVSDLLGLGGANSLDEAATRLASAYQLDGIAITRGSQGTSLYTQHAKHEGPPVSYPRETDADSVGAGDACCAGLLCGTLLGWSPEETVGLANRLGAYVATRPGATPELPPEILRQEAPPPRAG